MKQAVLVPEIKDLLLHKIFLTNDEFLIGRGLHNSQVIEDVNISRSHCVFRCKNNCWYLVDKSTNGTWLNGNLLDKTKEYKLLHDDLIELSINVKFKFKMCSDDESNKGETIAEPVPVYTVQTERCMESLNQNEFPSAVSAKTNDVNAFSSVLPAKTVVTEQPAEAAAKAKESGLTFAEDELQCSICTEMFIKAVTLSCSHSFCRHCISEWRKNQTICPICRTEIKVEYSTLVLDNFISKIVENASDELKEHRRTLMQEREAASGSAPGPSGNLSCKDSINLIEISSSDSSTDMEEGEEEEEEEEEEHENNYSFSYSDNEDDDDDDWSYDEDYNGLPGYYYGGYGNCYSCGQRGHWSNGCPTKRRR